MKVGIFLLVFVPLLCSPVQLFAQNLNSWGRVFDCGVDWFSQCSMRRENRPDELTQLQPASAKFPSLYEKSTAANLPLPVRNVLENPSPETAREYVLWSRERNEKLAKASKYIAQATREINSEAAAFRNDAEKSNDVTFAGQGPAGLYYFFSPGDESAVKDVAVLNKIWREGRLGVVGIPVKGKDEEIFNFVNEAKPLFPVRRGGAEVKLINPSETPELFLALPLQKKMFRLGSTITETAIAQAIAKILATQPRNRSILSAAEPH